MAHLPILKDAYLDFSEKEILGFGLMSDLPEVPFTGKVADMSGKSVMPAYIDCHTHLVFAATRAEEFEDRIKGLSYQEIAERGGGILNSARKLGEMSEDELFRDAFIRLDKLIRSGTSAIEIKSGYGLDLENELKMLRVIRRLRETFPITVRSTFLGAHAYPKTYADRKADYIDLIVDDMMPKVVDEQLADYVDVFCEKGYFELEATAKILEAANRLGLKARLHVNQFNSIGGIQLADRMHALSVEHLEVLTDDDMKTLESGSLLPVALPACSFFLKIPYTPGRQLIDNQMPLVLASDFNPGSSPTGNMSFVFSLACIHMNLLPAEAFNALTINAAHALEIQDREGSIDVGKKSNFMVVHHLNSLAEIPYHFAENRIDEVWINGLPYS